MSKIRLNGFKWLILVWCLCLLTKSVCLSSIRTFTNHDRNYQNDEETANRLKSILLRKLDLDKEPTNLGDTNVPNYLLDLFKSNSLESNRILSVNNSNTIRSHPLFDAGNSHPSQADHRARNRTGFLIKFNLSLPTRELLNSGEFRLFLNNTVSRCASARQRVEIHQVIQQLVDEEHFAKNRSSGSLGDFRVPKQLAINQYTTVEDESNLIYRLIDTQIAEQDESKWLQFDVLPAVESWLQMSATNFGLLIKCQCVDQNDLNLNDPTQFVDNLVFRDPVDQVDSLKPVLLTYSNFQNIDYEVDSLEYMNKKKRHTNEPMSLAQTKTGDWRSGKASRDCARYSLYVDFKEIGWEQWIIAPRGYDAFMCYGDCSLSVIRNGNSTNHATMQSLSNSIQPDLVPPPCCVPNEFAPITMIYKDKNATVLKIYDEMIMKSCACV